MADLYYNSPPTGLMPMSWDGKPAIWMTWTGSNPLPDLLALCLASVRRHNERDFEIIVVTPENIRDYIDPHPAYELLSYVHRADYLRLTLLHEYGGIYLDMDTIGLRSLAGVYSDLTKFDIVTYDGRPWGEIFGISVFGPTRRHSELTRAWKSALDVHLDRRYDDLARHRASDPNDRVDCLGWSEILRDIVLPISQKLVEEGRLSARILEPTWAHVAAGGPAWHELTETRPPEPPDTELLILNHAAMADNLRRMSSAEIFKSDLGICRLLQRALGHQQPQHDAAGGWTAEPSAKTRLQSHNTSEQRDKLLKASLPSPESPANISELGAQATQRAIVCYVENDHRHVQQFLALRESWLHVRSTDTDLVAFGLPEVLARLPHDVVKIAQAPVTQDPVWQGYRYANGIACINAAGSEQLDRYTHLLRTNTDTFVAPGWNQFYPAEFAWGEGTYANAEGVQERLQDIAAEYGLRYRGFTNIGVTWYGPTEVVRRTAAYAELLTKHLISEHFESVYGTLPGWSREAAVLYAGEIAVNHCVPDGRHSDQLDVCGTAAVPVATVAHVHSAKTSNAAPQHWLVSERHGSDGIADLDSGNARDYCVEMSRRSLAISAKE